MKQFAEEPRPIVILDETGKPITAGDHDRRFFEASWMHKYNGKYYFSYSTGDTHRLCYAIGDNPYGPFTYQGVILTPVVGWTTHHCIVEYKGKWYLFHHDSVPSGGRTWLRSLKVCELHYDEEGHIQTISGTDGRIIVWEDCCFAFSFVASFLHPYQRKTDVSYGFVWMQMPKRQMYIWIKVCDGRLP